MRIGALLDRDDDAVLEQALALARSTGAEVIALRAGPRDSDEALVRRAQSLGASQAVLLWDPSLEVVDYLGLATVLACALRTLDCRLIIAGDRGQGAVGPAVADRLDRPHLCGVIQATVSPDDPGAIQVERRVTDGIQRLRGPAEAVLCVLPLSERHAGATPLATPGEAVPPQDGVGGADRPEVLHWDLDEVGVSAALLVHRRHLTVSAEISAVEQPVPRRFDSAAALVARLRQDGLLPRRGR